MADSTRKAVVVPLVLENHPNADKLSIVNVDGYTVCVNTAMWEGKTKATFVPPDNYVPLNNPLFDFMDDGKGKDKILVKPCKLRGVRSTGILVPYGEDKEIGTDVTDELGIEHNDKDKMVENGIQKQVSGPKFAKYDIEALLKYNKLFNLGEVVNITEKIHGSQLRLINDDGIKVGTRKQWVEENDKNIYWRCYRKYPQLEKFLLENPQLCLYGEVYGMQKGYSYGTNGDYEFAAFDIMKKSGEFLGYYDFVDLVAKYGINTVPDLDTKKFSSVQDLYEYFSTNSLFCENTVKEGVVVKPIHERQDYKIGRVILKLINPEYKG